jgi:hypothetical protein
MSALRRSFVRGLHADGLVQLAVKIGILTAPLSECFTSDSCSRRHDAVWQPEPGGSNQSLDYRLVLFARRTTLTIRFRPWTHDSLYLAIFKAEQALNHNILARNALR